MIDMNDPLVAAFITKALTDPEFYPPILLDWLEEQGAEKLPPLEDRRKVNWAESLFWLCENSNYHLDHLAEKIGRVSEIDLRCVNEDVEIHPELQDQPDYADVTVVLDLDIEGNLLFSEPHYRRDVHGPALIGTFRPGDQLGEYPDCFRQRLDALRKRLFTTSLIDLLNIWYWSYQLSQNSPARLTELIEHQLQDALSEIAQRIEDVPPEFEEQEPEWQETVAYVDFYGDELSVVLNNATQQWIASNGQSYPTAEEAIQMEIYLEMAASGTLDDYETEMHNEFPIRYRNYN